MQDSPAEEVETTHPPAVSKEPPDEQVADKLDGVTFRARVVIHEALHLPLLRDGR